MLECIFLAPGEIDRKGPEKHMEVPPQQAFEFNLTPYFFGLLSSKLLDSNSVSRYCTSRFCLSPLLLWLESLLWRRRKSSPESGKSKKVCIQRPLTKIQGGAIFHMRDIRRNVLPKFIGALYGDALLLHCSDLTELYGWVGYSPNYNFAGIFFAFSKVILVFGLKVKFDRLC